MGVSQRLFERSTRPLGAFASRGCRLGAYRYCGCRVRHCFSDQTYHAFYVHYQGGQHGLGAHFFLALIPRPAKVVMPRQLAQFAFDSRVDSASLVLYSRPAGISNRKEVVQLT